MKYLSYGLEIFVAIFLWKTAFNFINHHLWTTGIIFILLGLDRIDVADLYWKIRNGK